MYNMVIVATNILDVARGIHVKYSHHKKEMVTM